MTTYLRNWLLGAPAASDPTPEITTSSPPPSDDGDDSDAETEKANDDDDSPPAFPSLSSAQRVQTASGLNGVPKILTDSEMMPPPPVPLLASRRPGTSGFSAGLAVPASASSSLAPPPTTTKPPPKPSKRREKVALAPGHSPLDWARLKSSGEDLRGVENLLRITPSMLKQHNKKDDAWSAFNGKVYNITAYLPFHPGGEKELMRVAGRDGTKLFALTHAWVNVDFMLDACLVGFLVSEPSS